MARNFHIDYGAKGGPALMDGDTGLEVGAEPKTKKGKIRLFLPLCLSYDHRVIDGADGARFINTFIQSLQEFPESELKGVE